MADAPEILDHSLFGRLVWHSKRSQWVVRHQLPSGNQLNVEISPFKTDRYTFIEPAAKLFQWAFDNEQTLLSHAINTYLLDLYNDSWRQEGEPEISATEFSAQLNWQLLKLTANSSVPMEFWYDPGELYESLGGHLVSVCVGQELQYRSAHLI